MNAIMLGMRHLLAALVLPLALAGCGDGDGGKKDEAAPETGLGITREDGPPVLTKADFKVRVHVTSMQCFGSAGCSVEYVVEPEYLGYADPSEGRYRVTYKVIGGDDPVIDSIEVEGGSMSFTEDGFVDTASSSSKLRAVVTNVRSLDY